MSRRSKRKQQPEPTEPVTYEYAVSVRKDGGRWRCVILQLADGRVVQEVVGEKVSRAAAIDYAQGVSYSLALGGRPHLPNATLREVA